jgi:hypothetical protein
MDETVPVVPPGALALARRQILRAVVAAIRPRGHGFDQPIEDDVAREVEDSIQSLPRLLGFWFEVGLFFIEYGTPLYARRLRRFSRLPPSDGLAILSRWERARGVRMALLRGLRFLIYFAFYQHPQVLAHMEIDWEGRAAMLVTRRAELLAQQDAAAGSHGD